MSLINWLHLSDWHQRGSDFDRSVVRKALIDDIRERAKIDPKLAQIDLVFFTGDLAFSGKKAEYETARKELLEPVLEAVGQDKDCLYIIPGNHDLDRDEIEMLPSSLPSPFETQEQVKTWLTDEKKRNRMLGPFEAYRDFVEEFGVPGFSWYGDAHTVEIRGVKIGILGLNSALMCGRMKDSKEQVNDYGYLTIGEPQMLECVTAIREADLRIALIHHPFPWQAAFDRDLTEAHIRQHCHFILRGHEHAQAIDRIVGTQGSGAIVSGGACYDGRVPNRPKYINAYNFVSFDARTGKGTIYLREWSEDDKAWIKYHRKDVTDKYTISLPGYKPPT